MSKPQIFEELAANSPWSHLQAQYIMKGSARVIGEQDFTLQKSYVGRPPLSNFISLMQWQTFYLWSRCYPKEAGLGLNICTCN